MRKRKMCGQGVVAAVLSLVMVVAGLVGPGSSWAADFPTRPIELVVPTPPGGGTDVAARVLAEATEPFLGQKVVVVNKPGGSGTIGVSYVVQAEADGYTLGGVWNSPLTITPHTLQVPYGTESYTPISQTSASTLVFCVRPDFGASNGKEFIETLRRNPDKFTYGTDGVAGGVQLSGERIFETQGVKVRAVPFGGAGETLKAFLGGHVDVYGGSIPPILPHVQAGRARCVLLTSRDANSALPGATSLSQLGIPEAATVQWRGVIGPKKLPADRLAILEKAFRQGAASPKFREFLESRGEAVVAGTAAEFKDVIRAEYEALGTIIKKLGLEKK